MLQSLDLFSGIGGITLGLKDWVSPVAYCEIDDYCRRLLECRMQDNQLPVAPIYSDVRELRGEGFDIDIITGGFPCQDISTAGNGAGLEGKRSGLFFEIVRLVKETKAPWVFLENVPAIRTRGLSKVIESFSEMGYDCRWTCLSAAELGAPHKRERWFLLAYSDSRRCDKNPNEKNGGRQDASLQERRQGDRWNETVSNGSVDVPDSDGIGLRHRRERSQEGEAKANCFTGHDGPKESLANSPSQGLQVSEGTEQKGDEGLECFSGKVTDWSIEPSVGRVVDGLPFRVDRVKALGNAVVPAQVSEAFKRLIGI